MKKSQSLYKKSRLFLKFYKISSEYQENKTKFSKSWQYQENQDQWTPCNYIIQQDDLGRRLMIAPNLKTFIEYEIFHKMFDIVSHYLATISVLAIHLKKGQMLFDVLRTYSIIKSEFFFSFRFIW